MIDRLTVEKIKDAANIVDVVSEFVTLKSRELTTKDFARFIMRRHHRLWCRQHVALAIASAVARVAMLSALLWNMSR